MSPARSVGVRLSLALLLVVAAALGTVYLIVVPRLEHRLVDAKLARLASDARLVRIGAQNNTAADLALVLNSPARVVLFTRLSDSAPVLSVTDDSRGLGSGFELEDDPLARRAATTLASVSGTVTRGETRFAEVVLPSSGDAVPGVLLSASLDDVLTNVHLVQRSLLLAGGLALALALVLGFGGASLFARRIRELERAAERIAGGRFDEPVRVSGSDELAELAEAFERMRQRLAQLDHARRDFIANASHELRTPLFSLGGFLELMDEGTIDEATRREFVRTMREQVARLTRLATDLLDLSRVDAGRLSVEQEPLPLAPVGLALVDEFRGLATASGHLISGEPGEDAVALADEERVLQIGRALVENAIRHTPSGTAVTVRTGAADGRATLEVEDSAGAIAPELGEHVFERFFRGTGSRSSGSGLGLSIARELAGLMGGSLVLERPAGRTRFVLSLPQGVFSRENGVPVSAGYS